MLLSQIIEGTQVHSVDHLLKLLHRKGSHSLRGRLGLEDAGLLREWIDALASCLGRLLLQLHVESTSKLEGAVLLQLRGRNLNDALDDSLHVLRLETGGFGDGAVDGGGREARGGLHALLHRLHGSHNEELECSGRLKRKVNGQSLET